VRAVPLLVEFSGVPDLPIRRVMVETTTGRVSHVKISPNRRRCFCLLEAPPRAAGGGEQTGTFTVAFLPASGGPFTRSIPVHAYATGGVSVGHPALLGPDRRPVALSAGSIGLRRPVRISRDAAVEVDAELADTRGVPFGSVSLLEVRPS